MSGSVIPLRPLGELSHSNGVKVSQRERNTCSRSCGLVSCISGSKAVKMSTLKFIVELPMVIVNQTSFEAVPGSSCEKLLLASELTE